MRVSRRATIGWGIVQLARRARRAVDGSVGARRRPVVLSLAAGPVLGAFLVGVLTTRVGAAAMLIGMIAGRRGRVGVVDRRVRVDLVRPDRCDVTAAVALAMSVIMPAPRRCLTRLLRQLKSFARLWRRARFQRPVEVGTRETRGAKRSVRSPTTDAPATTEDTIFDLASLTKVISTTTLVMRPWTMRRTR